MNMRCTYYTSPLILASNGRILGCTCVLVYMCGFCIPLSPMPMHLQVCIGPRPFGSVRMIRLAMIIYHWQNQFKKTITDSLTGVSALYVGT